MSSARKPAGVMSEQGRRQQGKQDHQSFGSHPAFHLLVGNQVIPGDLVQASSYRAGWTSFADVYMSQDGLALVRVVAFLFSGVQEGRARKIHRQRTRGHTGRNTTLHEEINPTGFPTTKHPLSSLAQICLRVRTRGTRN